LIKYDIDIILETIKKKYEEITKPYDSKQSKTYFSYGEQSTMGKQKRDELKKCLK
jgi:hypothetical protein